MVGKCYMSEYILHTMIVSTHRRYIRNTVHAIRQLNERIIAVLKLRAIKLNPYLFCRNMLKM